MVAFVDALIPELLPLLDPPLSDEALVEVALGLGVTRTTVLLVMT